MENKLQNLETPTKLSLKSTLPSTNSFKLPKTATKKFKRPADLEDLKPIPYEKFEFYEDDFKNVDGKKSKVDLSANSTPSTEKVGKKLPFTFNFGQIKKTCSTG